MPKSPFTKKNYFRPAFLQAYYTIHPLIKSFSGKCWVRRDYIWYCRLSILLPPPLGFPMFSISFVAYDRYVYPSKRLIQAQGSVRLAPGCCWYHGQSSTESHSMADKIYYVNYLDNQSYQEHFTEYHSFRRRKCLKSRS